MVSSKNVPSWGQLLSLLKSKGYTQLDSDMAKSRVKNRNTNIFTKGISSYSRDHEYIIYERKEAFLPPGNLLPGIKVSKDRRFNIIITKQPDKSMVARLGTKLSKSDSAGPNTKLPRIYGTIKINRDMEPKDEPQIELVTDMDEKNDEKENIGIKENENDKIKSHGEHTNSVEKVKHGSRKKGHQYLKKKRKVMKVPLFQSMTVTSSKKELTLSCTLTYDMRNGEEHDCGEVKETETMRNKLIPIMHQQVSPKGSSSTKAKQKSSQESHTGELLTCNGSKLFNKNRESTNPVKNNAENYLAQFGVPPNPPPSACAELFGLPRKGTV